VFPVLAPAALLVGGVILAGCPSTATVVTTLPISGIVIPSADLVAGHGCGTGPDQVFQYAATLAYQSTGKAFASAVVPCFADGVFSNIPGPPDAAVPDGGNPFLLTVTISAYNADSFPAALRCTEATTATTSVGPCPGDMLQEVKDQVGRFPPNWTTTCSAVELVGVPVQADCAPLALAGGGIGDAGDGMAADTAAAADGTVVADSTPADATPGEAEASEASETDQRTGDILPSDAGADATEEADRAAIGADALGLASTISIGTQAFLVGNDGGVATCGTTYDAVAATAQPRGAADGSAGAQVVVPCPSPVVLSVPSVAGSGTPYAIALELLKGNGRSVVGQTQCAATPTPGTDTLAWCAPVQLVR
jgi:hypothetical protein